MWEDLPVKKEKNTVSVLDWLKEQMQDSMALRAARDSIYEVEAKVPVIALYRTLPQSPPWHSEGSVLMDHVERMLVALYAIAREDFSILSLDEFASIHDLEPDFYIIQDIIRENFATLSAFIFLHDIGKQDTIIFNAPKGSLGASEGFFKDSKIPKNVLLDTYLKLVKVLMAEKNTDAVKTSVLFYEKYQIRVHYPRHAQLSAGEKYKKERQIISDHFRLIDRDREMLQLMIRFHIDAIDFFKNGIQPEKIDVMLARAGKRFIDGDDFLDVLAAALLLDTVFGSIEYKNGEFAVNMDPFLNFLRSEQLAVPHRANNRRIRFNKKQKDFYKSVLQKAGLELNNLFSVLNIKPGPQRGDVALLVEKIIKNEADIKDFNFNNQDIKNKLLAARDLYFKERS
ncbi:hypothetical protein D6827_03300 [Candidatus Parcubacteria bacterium]|nr:MAG: hypothetical protein D6827_03300 [Candidatus Parcubacteria bacterium]